MIYLNSSYIFKCYINEPGTREVLSCRAKQLRLR